MTEFEQKMLAALEAIARDVAWLREREERTDANMRQMGQRMARDVAVSFPR